MKTTFKKDWVEFLGMGNTVKYLSLREGKREKSVFSPDILNF